MFNKIEDEIKAAYNTGFASPRPDSIFTSAIASAENNAGRGDRKARERYV